MCNTGPLLEEGCIWKKPMDSSYGGNVLRSVTGKTKSTHDVRPSQLIGDTKIP